MTILLVQGEVIVILTRLYAQLISCELFQALNYLPRHPDWMFKFKIFSLSIHSAFFGVGRIVHTEF